jgi:transglutaminase-like putative cysteine protease
MKALDRMGVMVVLVAWASFALTHSTAIGVGLSTTAVLCALAKGRLPISRQQWLIWCLLSLVVSLNFFKPEGRNVAVTALVYPNLYPVALSLGLCTLPALLRRHTAREYWATLSIAGAFFLLCGLNLSPLTREFALLSLLWTVAFCLSGRHFLTGRCASWQAYLTLLPTIVLLGAIATAYVYTEHSANFLMRLLSRVSDASLAFPAQSKLNTLMNAETNPAVVVRYRSKRPARYLPARVYTKFGEGLWSSTDVSQVISGQPKADELFRFNWKEAAGSPVFETLEVRALPSVLYAPRDSLWLEMVHDKVALLSGHLFELRTTTLPLSGNLVRYEVARLPDEELAPPESPEYLQQCLQLPTKLHPEVAQSALRQGGSGPLMERARRLESWLQNDFTYGYGYDFGNSPDPIGEFLTKKPQAHCEIFAATLTLMLRTQKIPARYINGYVVVEPSWSGDYWIVRIRDAHAWVEVWDGQVWRRLDPTPPAAIAPPQSWSAWFDSLREWLSHVWGGLTNFGWRDLLGAAWDRRYWLLGLVVVAVLYRFRHRAWWETQARKSLKTPQHRWMEELSRLLQADGLERQSWETPLAWGERLRQSPHGGALADWLGDFSGYRYGSGSSEQEQALGVRWDALVRDLRSRTK